MLLIFVIENELYPNKFVENNRYTDRFMFNWQNCDSEINTKNSGLNIIAVTPFVLSTDRENIFSKNYVS